MTYVNVSAVASQCILELKCYHRLGLGVEECPSATVQTTQVDDTQKHLQMALVVLYINKLINVFVSPV